MKKANAIQLAFIHRKGSKYYTLGAKVIYELDSQMHILKEIPSSCLCGATEFWFKQCCLIDGKYYGIMGGSVCEFDGPAYTQICDTDCETLFSLNG